MTSSGRCCAFALDDEDEDEDEDDNEDMAESADDDNAAFAWLGLVVVPLAMVSTRKMWGLKGFGKEPDVDTWRGVLIPSIVGVAVGTWFGLGSVFLAVPLCLLLYLGLAMATTPQGQSH